MAGKEKHSQKKRTRQDGSSRIRRGEEMPVPRSLGKSQKKTQRTFIKGKENHGGAGGTFERRVIVEKSRKIEKRGWSAKDWGSNRPEKRNHQKGEEKKRLMFKKEEDIY